MGQTLQGVRVNTPFLLRTFDPPLEAVRGQTVRELRRLGKRIAIGAEDDLWLVIHLMIAGRLHWKPAAGKIAGRQSLAAVDFANGSLTLTEAGTKRRASIQMARGENGLAALDPGGIEPLEVDFDRFRTALSRENHTLKRALTDPRVISGV